MLNTNLTHHSEMTGIKQDHLRNTWTCGAYDLAGKTSNVWLIVSVTWVIIGDVGCDGNADAWLSNLVEEGFPGEVTVELRFDIHEGKQR